MSDGDVFTLRLEPVGGRPRRMLLEPAPATVGCAARLVEQEFREGAWREVGREPLHAAAINGEPLRAVLRAGAIRVGRADL